MARIVCIDDYPFYAEMVADMLRKEGKHEVKTEIVPLDLDEIRAYRPDLLVLNLVRKLETLRSPMRDFYTEVDGSKAYRAIAADPELSGYPLIITAIAVEESLIPRDLDYVAFLEVPQKIGMLPTIIRKALKTPRDRLAPE